ncbi:MAG: radical SAM family heme chaperone HemW, partial [Acidobacteria bacterium]|nr:radical SAM family heme chaperone HemW [Acidobacteriota bacterium]
MADESVSGKKANGWASEAVGLYIHVPFCASLCSYCDFCRVALDGAVPEWFATYILKEGDIYREPCPVELDSIYFGGGTPSLLALSEMARLCEGLRGIFHWMPDAEVTLEANPETVTAESLAAWRGAGVTRLSIGAQSFDETELRALGRRATPEDVRRAVRLAAQAGFSRLSLDLMLGIPGQTVASLSRTLDEAEAMPLDHLSAYMLDLHEKTGLYARVLSGQVSVPGEDDVAELYDRLCERLETAGFAHYEVSNFARPKGECRHNLRYWRQGDYIGIGPSAHGCFRGVRTKNPGSIEEWRASL